ncbi:hypothetical protein C8T65DRAFT_746222 [Cerioporus squamosus]|nr:hypothetical protein C8T65DRAFT_746222 [Cerioporus squamosus]
MNALFLGTQQTTTSIVPVFSGACVELTTSPRNSGPFAVDERQVELVFVIVAEIAPNAFAIVARDNYHAREGRPRSRLDAPRRSTFMSEIDEELSIATDEDSRTVALKPDDYAVWFQFAFEYDLEYWGFLTAITHVRSLQVTRRELVEQQFVRLRHEFLTFFKPKVAPYNDPEELERMRLKEERAQEEDGDDDDDGEDGDSDTMDDASDVVLVE